MFYGGYFFDSHCRRLESAWTKINSKLESLRHTFGALILTTFTYIDCCENSPAGCWHSFHSLLP